MNEQQDRRLKKDIVASETAYRDQLATAQTPLVVEDNRRGATALGLAAAAVIGAGAALVLSGGVSFRGGSEPTGSFSPTATPTASEAAGQSPDTTTLTLPDGSTWITGLLGRIAAAQSAAASASFEASASASASSNENLGAKIASGVELPSVISGDMTKAFVPGVIVNGNKIPTYQDSELFLPLYNAAQAEKGNWGPWAPIAIQNLDGAAHLKTEGTVGLFDLVADKQGKVALYFMQLGKHQHETAVNGNGQSNPNWLNQYTIHLKPFQKVWVIDRNGNQILWDDGKTPMALDAGPNGDFSIEVPQTADNQDIVFGLVLEVNPSASGIQDTANKFQHGPDDNPGKTGENKFAKLGIQAIVIPAIAEK